MKVPASSCCDLGLMELSSFHPGKEIVDKYGQQMPQYTAELMAYYSDTGKCPTSL
jgi:hypothetical protein